MSTRDAYTCCIIIMMTIIIIIIIVVVVNHCYYHCCSQPFAIITTHLMDLPWVCTLVLMFINFQPFVSPVVSSIYHTHYQTASILFQTFSIISTGIQPVSICKCGPLLYKNFLTGILGVREFPNSCREFPVSLLAFREFRDLSISKSLNASISESQYSFGISEISAFHWDSCIFNS